MRRTHFRNCFKCRLAASCITNLRAHSCGTTLQFVFAFDKIHVNCVAAT